jgi:hypothetical protein
LLTRTQRIGVTAPFQTTGQMDRLGQTQFQFMRRIKVQGEL